MKNENKAVVVKIQVRDRQNTLPYLDVSQALQLAAKKTCFIAIDTSEMYYINSQTLGLLLLEAANLQDRGSRLNVCGLTTVMQEWFKTLDVLTAFRIFKNVEECLESIQCKSSETIIAELEMDY